MLQLLQFTLFIQSAYVQSGIWPRRLSAHSNKHFILTFPRLELYIYIVTTASYYEKQNDTRTAADIRIYTVRNNMCILTAL